MNDDLNLMIIRTKWILEQKKSCFFFQLSYKFGSNSFEKNF